mgnify:CR=1 FL=1
MIERYYELIVLAVCCIVLATTMTLIATRLTYQAISRDYVQCLDIAVNQADCEYILGTFN